MGENLPVLPQAGSIDVITSKKDVPKIVHQLKSHVFIRDEETSDREVARYGALEDLPADYKGVLAAHKALEDGRAMIDISRVMSQRNSNNWPLLGVARLTDNIIFCRRYRTGEVKFSRPTILRRQRVFFETEGNTWSGDEHWVERQAAVPALPPDIVHKYDPRNEALRIIWEANWIKETREPPPRPRLDPAIIEHVAGSLYVIVAVWDLSQVEIAALGPKVG